MLRGQKKIGNHLIYNLSSRQSHSQLKLKLKLNFDIVSRPLLEAKKGKYRYLLKKEIAAS
jgi:hypothetical protein